jgi:uncharacterized membrane-anchored protein YhcB (DUF1043 family)
VTNRKALEESDETVTIPVRFAAYQRSTWARIILCIVVGMSVAIIAITWAYNHALDDAQRSLHQTQTALDRANAVITNLSSDSKCRSEAATDEASALNNLVIVLSTDRENRARVADAVTQLQEAHARRAKVATEGCPSSS